MIIFLVLGPGYGLTVTINIEAYEYTKDLSQGTGIKVLYFV